MAKGALLERGGRCRILIRLVLILLTAAAYGPIWRNDFINYDDNVYVTGNDHVKAGLSPKGIAWAFTSTEALNWHPLTWISLQLDCQLYGPHAWGFHLTNLLLHTANSLLLFWILQQMTGAVWRSALVAALFALHPLHVESVAWVAERKDVLSTLFWMLTLAAYLRYVRRPSVVRYLLVMLPLVLGLMAKAMLVTLPCVLLLLDYWPLKRVASGQWLVAREHSASLATSHWPLATLLLEKVPLFVLAVACGAIVVFAQQHGGALESLEQLSLSSRISNALVSSVQYMGKMFWPSGLAPFYPHPRESLPWWQAAGAGLLLISFSVLALRLAGRRPYLILGWLWYLGTLAPVIGIVQVGEQSMADRYTYVPLIGLFILLVWGIADLAARWPALKVMLIPTTAGALLICLVLTWLQVRIWHDSRSLWEHTLRVTTGNYVAENNLGFTFLQEGNMPAAEQHFRQAVRIKPDYARAYSNLGLALDRQRKTASAIACYAKSLQIYPNQATIRNNLGVALGKQGKMDEAIAQLFEAVRLDPNFAEANYNLVFALCRQKRFAEALPYCQECVRLEPYNATYRFALARILKEHGEIEAAAAQLREAKRLSSGRR